MQLSSVPRFSLKDQYLLRAVSTSLQWLGHPSGICWVSNCSAAFFFCSCSGAMHGISSCMVMSRPVFSIFSWGMTLVGASVSATSLSGINLTLLEAWPAHCGLLWWHMKCHHLWAMNLKIISIYWLQVLNQGLLWHRLFADVSTF